MREHFAAGACSSTARGCAAHLTQFWLLSDSHAARATVARTAVAAQSSSSAGASADIADAVAKLAKTAQALGKLQHQGRLLPYESLGSSVLGQLVVPNTFWTAPLPASASRRTQLLVRPPRCSIICHCDLFPSTFDRQRSFSALVHFCRTARAAPIKVRKLPYSIRKPATSTGRLFLRLAFALCSSAACAFLPERLLSAV